MGARPQSSADPTSAQQGARQVLDGLREVYDPCCREKGISVVDMGLVRSVDMADGVVRVELLLTSGWCPFASRVLGEVAERAEAVPGVTRADVEVVWDEAWTMDRLSDDARARLTFLPMPAQVADREAYVRAHDRRETEDS
ncbi:MAG: metal-sulfur cluster assembly factor [Actinomycetes bacterium]